MEIHAKKLILENLSNRDGSDGYKPKGIPKSLILVVNSEQNKKEVYPMNNQDDVNVDPNIKYLNIVTDRKNRPCMMYPTEERITIVPQEIIDTTFYHVKVKDFYIYEIPESNRPFHFVEFAEEIKKTEEIEDWDFISKLPTIGFTLIDTISLNKH